MASETRWCGLIAALSAGVRLRGRGDLRSRSRLVQRPRRCSDLPVEHFVPNVGMHWRWIPPDASRVGGKVGARRRLILASEVCGLATLH